MLQFQEIQTFLIKVRGWEEEIPSTKAKGMSGRALQWCLLCLPALLLGWFQSTAFVPGGSSG